MKTQLTFLVLFFTFSGFYAQNWQPFRGGEVYHYCLDSNTDSLVTSIYMDSVAVAGGDSIFFFQENFEYRPDIEKYIRHFPHFIGKQMIKRSDSSYLLKDDTLTFVLLPHSSLGQNWVCDSSTNVVATVTTLDTITLFGFQDSVKTISLSNGKSLQLSKNFGLIRCSDFYSGSTYVLAGLQNAAVGLHPLTISEIYDFEVGDVFMYEYNLLTNFPSTIIPNTCTKEKRTVLEKTIYQDSVKYLFARGKKLYVVTDGLISPCIISNNSFVSTDTFELTISLPSFSLENTTKGVHYIEYKNRIFPWLNMEGCFPPSIFALIRYDRDVNQVTSKNGFFTDSGTWMDTLSFYGLTTNFTWKKGLGLTLQKDDCFEAGSSIELKGYIKNGVQVGTIYPDWYFTDISSPSTAFCRLSPNPAFEEVEITSSQAVTIQVRDILGKLIHPTTFLPENTAFSLSLSGWSSGIYFIEMQNEAGEMSFQKLVKE